MSATAARTSLRGDDRQWFRFRSGGPAHTVIQRKRWFLGGGTEAALTSFGNGWFGNGWFWRNEYRYASYDSHALTDSTLPAWPQHHQLQADGADRHHATALQVQHGSLERSFENARAPASGRGGSCL